LFASDLPFIKDCCHEHANYFDPLSLDSMADVIARYYRTSPQENERKILSAYEFVQSYPGPQERAQAYLNIALDAVKA